jgi:murein tripeptide amidase MpaA
MSRLDPAGPAAGPASSAAVRAETIHREHVMAPIFVQLVVSSFAAVAPPAFQAAPPEHHHLAVIDLFDATSVHAAQQAGVALDCQGRLPNDRAEITVTDRQLAQMRRLGAQVQVTQRDLEEFYARRLAENRPPPPPSGIDWSGGSMGGYFTLAEMEALLDQLSAAYPNICTPKFSIGTTIEGRDIWAVKVSDNPFVDEGEPEVRIDALHHAREPVSMHPTLYFLDWLLENYGTDPLATHLVNDRALWFIPAVNPDGYEYNRSIAPNGGGMWRKNRRDNGGGSFGVDLNRNYSYEWGYDDGGSSPDPNNETYRGGGPTSEPEIAAMEAFISSRSFRTSISAHTYSDLWLFPWGYTCVDPPNRADFDLIAHWFTVDNQYVHGPICSTLYSANGCTVDYDFGNFATWSGTVEIGNSSDGFWPPTSRILPLLNENLRPFQRIALYAAAGLEGDDWSFHESKGDGDAWREPLEELDLALTVTNAGTLATNGSATLTLRSDSSDVEIVNGFVDFGSIAAFGQADDKSAPLRIRIAANATPGRHVHVTADLLYDGYTESHVTDLVIGEPVTLDLDDLEQDLGWTTGVPGDTATTGKWERSAPQQTTSGGAVVQPGADHSPSGTLCAVTDGRAGASAGTYDVDNGVTTLISPQFDLADANSPLVSYWRWFADMTVVDDAFVVEISDDDGATWSEVERVTANDNTWRQVTFDPSLYVAPTDRMRLRFTVGDTGSGSLVEALVDDLQFAAFAPARVAVWRYGTPTPGGTIRILEQGDVNRPFVLFAALAGAHLDLGKLGILELDPASLRTLLTGNTGASGRFTLQGAVPNDPALLGLELDLQSLVLDPSGAYLTNAIDFVIE